MISLLRSGKATMAVLLWAALACLPAGAAPPLTWETAVNEAAAKNPDIAAASQQLKSAEAQAGGAYSGFLPQLSASTGVTESNGPTNTSSGVPITGNSGTSQAQYSAGLNATENLFNGFLDSGKVHQTRANLEAARANLALVKANLSSSLKAAFAQLLFEQKSIDLTTSILKRQQANLRMIHLRFEGGQENKGNLLYQAATVSQARYQGDHALRQRKVAIKQLAVLLGQPDNEDIEVAGELTARPPSSSMDLRAAAMRNPSHVQAYYQQAAARAAVEIADAGWYPSLSVTGFVGKTGPDFPPASNRWSVGASVSFPFFPGTSQIYGAESARAQAMQSEYSTLSTDNKLIASLEQAYGGLVDAIEQVRVADEFQSAAKARSTIATEKYNTGLMSFEDWSVIETDLITREQNLLNSQLSAMQAQATWENAQGIGDIP